MLAYSKKSMKKKVDEDSRFVRTGHRSSLASAGWGGRVKDAAIHPLDGLQNLQILHTQLLMLWGDRADH